MTEAFLTEEDLEDLKRFPFLWRAYQAQQEEAKAEGRREGRREAILDLLATRFDPPISEYRKVEQLLVPVADMQALNEIFRQAVLAPDLATFAASLPALVGSKGLSE